MAREFYKTVISFTVLSEEPIPPTFTLEQIASETCDGRYVGNWSAGGPILLNGAAMVDELREAGSCPDFFELNEDGTDDEEDYDFETALRGECGGCDDDECDNYVRHLTDDDPYK